MCIEAHDEYQERYKSANKIFSGQLLVNLSTTCPVRDVSAEIPQGVPGGLVAAEGGGDVGRGHRGVDRHVVGGQGGVWLRGARVGGL